MSHKGILRVKGCVFLPPERVYKQPFITPFLRHKVTTAQHQLLSIKKYQENQLKKILNDFYAIESPPCHPCPT